MPFHIYKVWKEGQQPRWFGVRVEYDEDRWVSTCTAVDARGNELREAGSVTPRFYGVTPEQALRRMIEALEGVFDEVVSAPLLDDR